MLDKLISAAGMLVKARASADMWEAKVKRLIGDVAKDTGRGSMKALASDIQVSESYLCDVRYNRRNISTDTARKIAGLK